MKNKQNNDPLKNVIINNPRAQERIAIKEAERENRNTDNKNSNDKSNNTALWGI